MPGNFKSPDGDIATLYLTDYALIDRYSTTGSLWMWGIGSSGQLGTNNTTSYSSPVQTVSGGTNWRQVSVGTGSVMTSAIKTDGTLWTWGDNSNGGLGTGDTTSRSSPVQTISAGTNWYQVSTDIQFQGAIKTDGTLWLWGRNTKGQLGTNDTTGYSSPVQTVSAGNNWKQVGCGYDQTAAIKTDGTLWLWGNNFNGQLGNNTSGSGTFKSSPVQTVAGGTNWKQVSAGYATGAVKTDGTLWMWGRNFYGALGDNTMTNRSSPVQTVAAGTNWKQVSTGLYDTLAVKTDGTLWGWGYNYLGALGTNNTTSYSSPVQTVSGGTNWKQVSTGYATSAVKTDGTLWTWGRGLNGQLGTGNTTNRSSPVQTVAGGTNWKQVSTGSYTGAIYFYDPGNLYPSA